MKLLAVFVSLFVSSAAFAMKNECLVTVAKASGVTSAVVEMEMVQHPKADIVGYRLDINVEGFKVFASEVDGNYWGKITAASGASVDGEAHDEALSLSLTENNETISVECY